MISKILRLIRELCPYEEVFEDSQLIINGILDSLSIIVLIGRLEDEFRVVISDDAVTAENFSTVKTIEQLIIRSEKI